MPMGRLSPMPTTASRMFRVMPPQLVTDTCWNPGMLLYAAQQDDAEDEGDHDVYDDPTGGHVRVPGQQPAHEQCRDVGHQQQPNVHAHSLEAVGQEGKQRDYRHHADGQPLGDAPSRHGPPYSQRRRYQEQGHLGPPEAVLAGAGALGVVLPDDQLSAQHPDHRPFGAHNYPAQAVHQGQDSDRSRNQRQDGVEPGVEQVLQHPADNPHLRTGRPQHAHSLPRRGGLGWGCVASDATLSPR